MFLFSLKYAAVVTVGAMADNSTTPSKVLAFLLAYDMHHHRFQDKAFYKGETQRTRKITLTSYISVFRKRHKKICTKTSLSKGHTLS